MQATRYAPCTGACRPHGAARCARSSARRACPGRAAPVRRARPGAAADRSLRPDQHPPRKSQRLQRVFGSGHGRHHDHQRAGHLERRQHPVARTRGDRRRLDRREDRHVRHVLHVGDRRAGDRPVDPVGHAAVLRHADPRRRLHVPRDDCRRRELAPLVFSGRHCAGHADRAGQSGAHPDHRRVRCVGRDDPGWSCTRPSGMSSARSSSARR